LIQSVIIENFQAHKHSVFNFDKGLNLVVGSSNQGKTSLVRALSLVLYNQWDKSWTRVGSAFCKITLVMDNGVTVIREKGEKVNKYLLQVPNAAPQEFTNFGVEVPEAISKVLHIGKIELDKDDSLTLNYASQLEPLFLFNRSGSQKAKVFGRLSGAHYLDHALRNLNAEKKQISVEKNLKAKELEELKVQHSVLSGVSEIQPKIEELETKSATLDAASLRVVELKSLFARVLDWKRRYGIETAKESTLAQAKTVEIDPVTASVQRLKDLKQLLNRKNELSSREMVLNSTKNQLETDFSMATTEYVRILSENNVCPTCFGILDAQKLDEIKNNLIGKEKCRI
jgi:DNA repair protein SbcC/Rad50